MKSIACKPRQIWGETWANESKKPTDRRGCSEKVAAKPRNGGNVDTLTSVQFRWRMAGVGLVVAALMVALWTKSWFVADAVSGELYAGLQDTTLCNGSGCHSSPQFWQGSFAAFLNIVWLAGFGLAASAIVAMFLDGQARAKTWKLLVLAMTTIFVASWIGLLVTRPVELGFAPGFSLWLGLIASLGVFAATWATQIVRWTKRNKAAVQPASSGQAQAIGPSARRNSGEFRVAPPLNALDLPKMSEGAESGPDASRRSLRFVAKSVEINDAGLAVNSDRGETFFVNWTHVLGLCARQLPTDPPFERTLFLDIVFTHPQGMRPIRLLPLTLVNYATLPDGQAPNSKENFRRLAAYLCRRNPAIAIDAESRPFLLNNAAPTQLANMRQLAQYDERYTG